MLVSDVLAAGSGAIGGWLACGRALAARVGMQMLEPVVRLVTGAAPPELEAAGPEAPTATEEGGPQGRVEEAKFYLGAAAPAPVRLGVAPPATVRVDREEGEVPRSYGVDRLVLLPRDPWSLFAYWELTPTTRLAALRALGAEAREACEVLRIHDVTFLTFAGDNAWHTVDVELPPGAESWYVQVWQPAASYCAEIGLRTASGRIVPLLRSNTITAPRAAPAADTTVGWMDLGSVPPRAAEPAWRGERLPLASAPEGTLASEGPAASQPGGSSDRQAPPH